jgi:translation initiation factor IF-2
MSELTQLSVAVQALSQEIKSLNNNQIKSDAVASTRHDELNGRLGRIENRINEVTEIAYKNDFTQSLELLEKQMSEERQQIRKHAVWISRISEALKLLSKGKIDEADKIIVNINQSQHQEAEGGDADNTNDMTIGK